MKRSNSNTNSSSITTDWMSNLVTLPQLLNMDFPPPSWLVPNIIPQGLTLLAGKPKAGKSFFALEVSLAIAAGSHAFGSENHQCEQGKVLYCALEDPLPRLQRRTEGLLGNGVSPTTNLFVTNQLPKMDEGGIECLNAWYREHPDTKLIVVDVLSRFKSHRKGQRGGTLYDQEYDVLGLLHEFALQNNVSILLVHHLTKRVSPDDVFDDISGSRALAAVPDTLLVLKRTGNNATLHIQGRDIEQQQLGFISEAAGDTCSWQLVGEVSEKQVSSERQDIIDLLDESPPLGPKDIAEKLNKSGDSTRKLLSKMVKQQDPAIERIDGKYTIAGTSHSGHRVTPNDIDPSHSGHNGHSSKMVKVDGHNTGHTHNHEEPSDSKCSDQSVTGVIAVTGTVDQDLRVALEQVPFANYRQKIEDAIGNGMSKEEAMKAAEMIKNGRLYIASDLLSQYPEPEPQEGNEGGEDMLW